MADRRSLVDALAQSAFVVTAALSSIGAAHDLSLTQVRVLGILRDRRLRMAELADYLGLERSTMSGLIDRAEGRGLLTRARRADDGRVIEVALTEAGRELARSAYAEVESALAGSVARLNARQQDELALLIELFLGPTLDPGAESARGLRSRDTALKDGGETREENW